MSKEPLTKPAVRVTSFDQAAAQPRSGFLRELGRFLLDNKKWWLAPLILVLVLFGALLLLAGTGAAPFIYTLF